jgi:hypothetical protein
VMIFSRMMTMTMARTPEGKSRTTRVPAATPSRGAFNRCVKSAQLAIADAAANSDHLVSPEDANRLATARQ